MPGKNDEGLFAPIFVVGMVGMNAWVRPCSDNMLLIEEGNTKPSLFTKRTFPAEGPEARLVFLETSGVSLTVKDQDSLKGALAFPYGDSGHTSPIDGVLMLLSEDNTEEKPAIVYAGGYPLYLYLTKENAVQVTNQPIDLVTAN